VLFGINRRPRDGPIPNRRSSVKCRKDSFFHDEFVVDDQFVRDEEGNTRDSLIPSLLWAQRVSFDVELLS
jgi:hypothetical protein